MGYKKTLYASFKNIPTWTIHKHHPDTDFCRWDCWLRMSVRDITKPKNEGREASAIVNIRHSKELLI
jgi:hypothetical protein